MMFKIKKQDPLFQTGDKVILLLTLGLYNVPVLLDLIINGWQRVFSYFAADTFYYLVIAKNYAQYHFFSFDQVYPTNGFHPAWQVMAALLYRLFDWARLDMAPILLAYLAVSLLLISGAIWFFALAFRQAYSRIPVWFIFLPVGIYALLMAPVFHRYGTLWSFSNAMESPLLLFSFALFMWVVTKKEFYRSIPLSILAGLALCLIFLARLDHILLAPAFFAMILLQSILLRKPGEGLRSLVVMGLIISMTIGAYLLVNRLTVGMWTPVSGSLKSTFPDPVAGMVKLDELANLLKTVADENFGFNIWRYAQIILPMVFAFFAGVGRVTRLAQKRMAQMDWFFISMAVFVWLLGLYNFLFVPTLDQGHWYFPVSITLMTLLSIDWFSRLRWNTRVLTALLPALGLAFFLLVYRDAGYNERYAWFYREAARIQAYYRGQTVKLIEYDDGIIAYTTGFPALTGFGFCLDRESSMAYQQGRLVDLAYERGYRYLASYYYFGFGRFSPGSSSAEIKTYLASIGVIPPGDAEKYTFQVDYLSEDGRFSIIRMDQP